MASSSSGSEDEWGQVKWRRYQHGCAVVQSSWSYSLRVECAKFLLLESAQPAQLNAFSHIFPIPFAHSPTSTTAQLLKANSDEEGEEIQIEFDSVAVRCALVCFACLRARNYFFNQI